MKRKLLNKTDLLSIGLCLLSILPGLMVYDRLPERVGIHFALNGEADQFAPRAVAVFVSPLIIALVQTILCITTNRMQKEKEISKAEKVIRYVTPTLSYVLEISTLMYAMGKLTNILTIAGILETVLLFLYGNYAPKLRRNTFFGVRTPHTLASPELWDRTHRFAGVLYIVAGIFCMFLTVMEANPILLVILLIVTIGIPFLYSEILYRRMKKAGEKKEIVDTEP